MYILVAGILIKILLLTFWLLLVIINNKSIKYLIYYNLREYKYLCFLEYCYVFKLLKILNIFLSKYFSHCTCPFVHFVRRLVLYAHRMQSSPQPSYMCFTWILNDMLNKNAQLKSPRHRTTVKTTQTDRGTSWGSGTGTGTGTTAATVSAKSAWTTLGTRSHKNSGRECESPEYFMSTSRPLTMASVRTPK